MSSLVAANALSVGIHAVAPEIGVVVLPMADGGEGTLDLLLAHGFAGHRVEVCGADGEPLTAQIAWDGTTAVVESACICGPLPGRPTDAVQATSTGVGEAVLAALDLDPAYVVLALGGSSTTDGGVGFLAALGVRFLGRDGGPIAPGAAGLGDIARVDWSGLDPRVLRVGLRVACDVENPLHGPCGTATVFAPQKGASPTEVSLLEAGLRQLAHAVESSPEPPIGAAGAATAATAIGAGAAGGLGYAALVLGAEYVSGAGFALGVTHGPARLAGSLLAVTGEGSLDAQSLRGKAPRVVAAAAAAAGVPTIAVVGRNLLEESQLREAGIAACFALLDRDAGCARSEPRSVRALTAIGEEIGAVLTSTVQRSEWNRDQRDLAARLERRRSGMQVSRSAHP